MLYMPRSGLACHVCRTALGAAMLIAMAAAWCGGALATFDVKKIEASVFKIYTERKTGMGTGTGKCMLWVPDGSNMKGAGAGGADIGANVLRRYRNGTLTSERLWDAATGRFPCGATVAGVNDNPARTCIGVHARLNVNTNGCAFPDGY